MNDSATRIRPGLPHASALAMVRDRLLTAAAFLAVAALVAGVPPFR